MTYATLSQAPTGPNADRAGIPINPRPPTPRVGAPTLDRTRTVQPTGNLLADWTANVARVLPDLNGSVRAGRLSPEGLRATLHLVISPLVAALPDDDAADNLTEREALQALQGLTFVVNSVEAAFQAARHEPGVGLSGMAEVEQLLLRLGQHAGHRPAASAYTVWLLRLGARLTFTGDPQEDLFFDVVCAANDLWASSGELIKPIASGDIKLDDPDAVRRLTRAGQLNERVFAEYMRLTAKNEAGEPAFSPAFFMTKYRTYLVGYPVGGEDFEGASAANLTSAWSLDLLTGIDAAWYRHLIEQKSAAVPDRERSELRRDASVGSVAYRVLDALEIDAFTLPGLAEAQLVEKVSSSKPALLSAFDAFASLYEAIAKASNRHFGMVNSHLVRPSGALKPEEKAALTVNPEKGTGGLDVMGQLKAIFALRREHPVLQPLSKAIRTARRVAPVAAQ